MCKMLCPCPAHGEGSINGSSNPCGMWSISGGSCCEYSGVKWGWECWEGEQRGRQEGEADESSKK